MFSDPGTALDVFCIPFEGGLGALRERCWQKKELLGDRSIARSLKSVNMVTVPFISLYEALSKQSGRSSPSIIAIEAEKVQRG